MFRSGTMGLLIDCVIVGASFLTSVSIDNLSYVYMTFVGRNDSGYS